jgi:mRNA interferase HigB
MCVDGSHFAKYSDLRGRCYLWIISKSRLREFWKEHSDAEAPLSAWYKHVDSVDWRKSADVKASYRTVDFVGDCAVFNIGGNKYRLVTRILYRVHKAFILRVMTHQEYDAEPWAKECGCHEPPPKSKTTTTAAPTRRRKR